MRTSAAEVLAYLDSKNLDLSNQPFKEYYFLEHYVSNIKYSPYTCALRNSITQQGW